MSTSHTLTRSYNNGVEVTSTSETVTSGGVAIVLDENIPQSQTDLAVAFAFTKSKLKSFFIKCDKAITIETNDGSSPQETITLTAGQHIQWSVADAALIPNPFGGNVTGLYVTTGAVGTARLQFTVNVDPT